MNTQSLLQQKPFLFWLLQVIGFTGYGLINYLPKIYLKEIHVPEYYSLYIILVCAAGIVVTLGLRWLYRYTWDMGNIWRITGFIAGSIVASIIWNVIRFQLFGIIISSPGESSFYDVLFYSFSDFWVMAGWTGLYVGIKYYLLLQEEREQRLKLAAMAQEAQLSMLLLR